MNSNHAVLMHRPRKGLTHKNTNVRKALYLSEKSNSGNNKSRWSETNRVSAKTRHLTTGLKAKRVLFPKHVFRTLSFLPLMPTTYSSAFELIHELSIR